jgi:hypothetical protein
MTPQAFLVLTQRNGSKTHLNVAHIVAFGSSADPYDAATQSALVHVVSGVSYAVVETVEEIESLLRSITGVTPGTPSPVRFYRPS